MPVNIINQTKTHGKIKLVLPVSTIRILNQKDIRGFLSSVYILNSDHYFLDFHKFQIRDHSFMR
jgi:hypothetical protein